MFFVAQRGVSEPAVEMGEPLDPQRGRFGLCLVLAVALLAGAPQAQKFPSTKDEFYETGQRFGRCAAYFGMLAGSSEKMALPECLTHNDVESYQ